MGVSVCGAAVSRPIPGELPLLTARTKRPSHDRWRGGRPHDTSYTSVVQRGGVWASSASWTLGDLPGLTLFWLIRTAPRKVGQELTGRGSSSPSRLETVSEAAKLVLALAQTPLSRRAPNRRCCMQAWRTLVGLAERTS